MRPYVEIGNKYVVINSEAALSAMAQSWPWGSQVADKIVKTCVCKTVDIYIAGPLPGSKLP